MGWVTDAKEALSRGESITLNVYGYSMRGRVNNGDLVTLEPCDPAALQVGDVVLVRIGEHDLLRQIKEIGGGRFLIGNNVGDINGWAEPDGIYGVATRIEPGQ